LQKNNAGADSKQLNLNFKKWRMAVIFKKLKKNCCYFATVQVYSALIGPI